MTAVSKQSSMLDLKTHPLRNFEVSGRWNQALNIWWIQIYRLGPRPHPKCQWEGLPSWGCEKSCRFIKIAKVALKFVWALRWKWIQATLRWWVKKSRSRNDELGAPLSETPRTPRPMDQGLSCPSAIWLSTKTRVATDNGKQQLTDSETSPRITTGNRCWCLEKHASMFHWLKQMCITKFQAKDQTTQRKLPPMHLTPGLSNKITTQLATGNRIIRR